MKDYLYKYREALFACIPALVIFLLAIYRLSETGQPILFNDEIGYWSNSAFFLGMDWKSVTGRIGYYSYGYSLLLVPVRLLGRWFAWDWATLHHAAVMMNAGFLVSGYVIALKLAKRYLPEMGSVVRIMACFTIFTYSSYIVYAHITWTECTLMFFFWVFLYVMMRLTDRPGVWNHAAYAAVSFYIYTVHQRALGIVVTSVIIVLYMRILRRNKMKDTAAFFGTLYLCGLCHAMIKTNLQQVNYLGGEPVGIRGLLSYAFTKTSFVFLAGGLILLLILYLIEKRKYKILLAFLAGGAVLCAAAFLSGGQALLHSEAGEGNRLAVNDFSGQWGVVKNLLTAKGLARLGISIAGKWFYMAAASGLVVCWGIWGLFKNIWYLLKDSISQMKISYGRQTREDGDPIKIAGLEERIWLFGIFLAWFGTLLISAIYKEGFYKNDDLFNGRYVEFTVGIVLLYGFYCLLNDKKWVRTAVLYVILYIAAGKLCQHLVVGIQRQVFEL